MPVSLFLCPGIELRCYRSFICARIRFVHETETSHRLPDLPYGKHLANIERAVLEDADHRRGYTTNEIERNALPLNLCYTIATRHPNHNLLNTRVVYVVFTQVLILFQSVIHATCQPRNPSTDDRQRKSDPRSSLTTVHGFRDIETCHHAPCNRTSNFY